jgi:hypothetical protein
VRRILSVPGFIATTAVTALISWGVNDAVTVAATRSGPPVQVVVHTDPAQIPAFGPAPQSAVLPAGRDAGSPGPNCNGFYPWVQRNGGVSDPAEFEIVAQSDTTQAVHFSNMRVRVLHRLPSVSGPAVGCPTAGPTPFEWININLDASPPTVTLRSGQPFGFDLQDGQTEVFEVTAAARHAHYLFEIELDVIVGGHSQTIRVTDQGRPFQATASPKSAEWEWDWHRAWKQYTSSGITRTVLAGRPFPPGG